MGRRRVEWVWRQEVELQLDTGTNRLWIGKTVRL